jgi:methyl-accepting chemotaxis protein
MKIRNKILVAPAIMAFVMTLWAVFYLLPLFEENILKEKQTATRHVVETTFGLLAEIDGQVKNGTIAPEDGKKLAAQRLSNLRYEDKEYFFISDLQPRMVMHPINPGLNGKDLTDVKDPSGKPIFLEFARICKEKGGGLLIISGPSLGRVSRFPRFLMSNSLNLGDGLLAAGYT